MLKHGLEHAQCLSGSMSNKGIPRNLTLHQSWKETTTGPWPKPFRLILFVYSHLNIILLYNHASTNRILFVFHKNFLISFFYSIRDMCAYIYIPLRNSSYATQKHQVRSVNCEAFPCIISYFLPSVWMIYLSTSFSNALKFLSSVTGNIQNDTGTSTVPWIKVNMGSTTAAFPGLNSITVRKASFTYQDYFQWMLSRYMH